MNMMSIIRKSIKLNKYLSGSPTDQTTTDLKVRGNLTIDIVRGKGGFGEYNQEEPTNEKQEETKKVEL